VIEISPGSNSSARLPFNSDSLTRSLISSATIHR
jgi:hypothetical protein